MKRSILLGTIGTVLIASPAMAEAQIYTLDSEGFIEVETLEESEVWVEIRKDLDTLKSGITVDKKIKFELEEGEYELIIKESEESLDVITQETIKVNLHGGELDGDYKQQISDLLDREDFVIKDGNLIVKMGLETEVNHMVEFSNREELIEKLNTLKEETGVGPIEGWEMFYLKINTPYSIKINIKEGEELLGVIDGQQPDITKEFLYSEMKSLGLDTLNYESINHLEGYLNSHVSQTVDINLIKIENPLEEKVKEFLNESNFKTKDGVVLLKIKSGNNPVFNFTDEDDLIMKIRRHMETFKIDNTDGWELFYSEIKTPYEISIDLIDTDGGILGNIKEYQPNITEESITNKLKEIGINIEEYEMTRENYIDLNRFVGNNYTLILVEKEGPEIPEMPENPEVPEENKEVEVNFITTTGDIIKTYKISETEKDVDIKIITNNYNIEGKVPNNINILEGLLNIDFSEVQDEISFNITVKLKDIVNPAPETEDEENKDEYGTITIYHEDLEGRILEREVKDVKVGEEINLRAINIRGYELSRKSNYTEKLTLTKDGENKIVTFIYEEDSYGYRHNYGDLTIHYEDVNGNELRRPEIQELRIDEPYTIKSLEIKGYTVKGKSEYKIELTERYNKDEIVFIYEQDKSTGENKNIKYTSKEIQSEKNLDKLLNMLIDRPNTDDELRYNKEIQSRYDLLSNKESGVIGYDNNLKSNRTQNTWATQSIDYLESKGYWESTGVKNEADYNMTYGEFLETLTLAMQGENLMKSIESDTTGQLKYAQMLTAQGIIPPTDYEEMFREITREEVLEIISKTFSANNIIYKSKNLNEFSDYSREVGVDKYVIDIVNGTGNNNGDMDKEATKAETLTFIYRALKMEK